MLWTGGRALAFSLILTPICRDVFRSYRVVDQPGEARKLHQRPIPRVGGIAIVLSYVLAFMISRDRSGVLSSGVSLVWHLLPATATIFVVGLVDDLMGLKPWQKLLGQTVAAVLAFSVGVRVFHGAGLSWGLAWSFPVTVFWLVLCANALNLVDGMDGLAAGVGLFATLTIFVSAVIEKNPQLALVTLPMAGCLLGFLVYNFNPATIFLGDSGSLLVGFLLGCYGAIWGNKSSTFLGMAAPLMVLSIPLLDASLSVVRRVLRHKPIFKADREHIHHQLLARGLRPRQAVLLMYAGCALAAGFSLLQRVVRTTEVSILILVLFGVGLWIGVRFLHYAEFGAARRLITGGDLFRSLNERLQMQTCGRALAEASTPEECWRLVREAARSFGFNSVRLRLLDRTWEETFEEAAEDQCWSAQIPLAGSGTLELRRPLSPSGSSNNVSALVELLHASLSAKLAPADGRVPFEASASPSQSAR